MSDSKKTTDSQTHNITSTNNDYYTNANYTYVTYHLSTDSQTCDFSSTSPTILITPYQWTASISGSTYTNTKSKSASTIKEDDVIEVELSDGSNIKMKVKDYMMFISLYKMFPSELTKDEFMEKYATFLI